MDKPDAIPQIGVSLMEKETPAGNAVEAVKAALLKTGEENAHLKDILRAFGGIIIEQAQWKETLPDQQCGEIGSPDPALFSKGVPVTGRDRLIHLGAMWQTAVERLFPSLAEGFPKISEELGRLRTSIQDGSFAPDLFLGAALGGREDEARAIARQAGFDPGLLEFALVQAAKPVLEKRSEAYGALIEDLTWNEGYCPVCGSLPGLSLLRSKEGQRWLRCGFCGAEWRFLRMSCPCCEGLEPDDREVLFVEGREHERVEVCRKCNKYVVGMDVRSLFAEFIPEVAALTLLHLDVLARQRGFSPMYASGLQCLTVC
ncbi:MAG: formate dehydrogenase accessory protein FdhE [Syntrophobacteraceae bacterium]|jgi:FdhE protein